MELNKEEIKYIINKDMMLKSPLWALLILAIWGAISFAMIWTLLNIIKPSIDRKMQNKKEANLIHLDISNRINKKNITLIKVHFNRE